MQRLAMTLLTLSVLAASVSLLAGTAPPPARAAAMHVHYVDTDPGGAREAIVLIHGWASDHTFLSAQLEGLRDRARVIAIDLPGHGKSAAPAIRYSMDSYADAIALVLEDASVDTAVLIGHSNGVPTIRQFYRRYPERTQALVGIDGAFLSVFPPEMVKPFVEQLSSDDYLETLHTIAGPMVNMSSLDQRQKDHILGVMLDTPQHVLVQSLIAGNEPSIWIDDTIDVPTLVVNARNPMFSQSYLDEVAAIGEDIDIHVWDGVSHMLMMEKPDEFNALVGSFLDERNLLQRSTTRAHGESQ